MKKRIVAWILVLSLLLMPGCTGKKGSSAPADDFAQKVTKLEDQNSIKLKLNVVAQKTLGTFSYEEETQVKAEYTDLHTDHPVAKIKTEERLNEEVLTFKEQYIDGKAYLELDSGDYVSQMPFEDYAASQYPVSILDPANYETVTYDKKTSTFCFKDATAVESWIAPEFTQLLSAEGTATLDAKGKLSAMTYTASYIQGPVTVDATCTMKYSDTDLEADDLNPEEDAVEVVDISMPYYLSRGRMAMQLQAPVSATENTVVTSELVGCYYAMYTEVDSYIDETQSIARIHNTLQVTDAYGDIQAEMTHLYKDGKSTYTVDDEEPVVEDMSFEDYQDYIWRGLLQAVLVDEWWIESISVTPVSDYWLFEYEMQEDFGETLQRFAALILLSDETAMDAYVEQIKPETLSGWISLDMDTLLPASIGLSGKIIQMVEGQECVLTLDITQNVEYGDPDAYENIMEEPLPDVEPENKPTPLLYEVTDGNGGKMYLFGTIHVGDDATAFLPDYVTNALLESDALGVEMNTQTLDERMETDEKLVEAYMKGMMYSDGTLTADKLSEETATQLEQLLKAMGRQPYMEYYLPSAISTFLPYMALDRINGLYQSKGVDTRLIKMAQDHNIEILEVEDIYEHVSLDAKYSEKTQILILEDSLEIYRIWVMEGLKETYDAWCRGDEEELTAMIHEEIDPEEELTEEEQAALDEYNQFLSVERDALMIEKAEEYLASGETVFFAVGLAHLLSETGLVDGLRAAGYTVTLISQS